MSNIYSFLFFIFVFIFFMIYKCLGHFCYTALNELIYKSLSPKIILDKMAEEKNSTIADT